MTTFRHKRTGKTIEVSEGNAPRYRNGRYEEIGITPVGVVPTGTVAEVLDWAGEDPTRRAVALKTEVAGKKRKGIIEALS